MSITPLEPWIREKTGIGPGPTGSLFVAALQDYQLERLNRIIDYARSNAPFYRGRLASVPGIPLSALSDMSRLPFTFASDLAENPFRFLAMRQDSIARIVTLRTSGSTGESKRLFFTERDLELTIDFFHHGMSTLVRPGQRVAILLPGDKPDSVGDLLFRGLRRMDVDSLVYGAVKDPAHAASAIASFGADCVVGIPTQVLAVARSWSGFPGTKGGVRAGVEVPDTAQPEKEAFSLGGKAQVPVIESVLLSTDYVPGAIVRQLETLWGCRVFNHYGMTEMGLGGGVECDALDGYHLRETDFYFEVVDHETGEVCPDGVMGEVVFTTLTREGMPLIRYRTGDMARMVVEPCPCGSVLRRMEPVRGRWDGIVGMGGERALHLPDMDEALFALGGLLDYRATVLKNAGGTFLLYIDVYKVEEDGPTEGDILEALGRVEAIDKGVAEGTLERPVVRFSEKGRWATTGVEKRRIITTSGRFDGEKRRVNKDLKG